MKKLGLLTAVSALALMGFALGASAHDSPNGNNSHGSASYGCTAKVSGSYLGNANTTHGKSTEMGKISAQGRFNWSGTQTDVCDGEPGKVLEDGYSVTRAANGDLVFVDYTSGTNCVVSYDPPVVAIVDIMGVVTGGTGKFDGVSGQAVHTVSEIYPTSTDFNFGGTVTVSNNECLLE